MKTLVNNKTIDIIIDRIQDIYESEATWDEDYGIPLLSRKGYGLLEVLLGDREVLMCPHGGICSFDEIRGEHIKLWEMFKKCLERKEKGEEK